MPKLYIMECGPYIRTHPSYVPDVPPQMLAQSDVLKPQTAYARKAAKHLLPSNEGGTLTSHGLRERPILPSVRRTIDEEQILLWDPNHYVQFPIPTKQALNVRPW